jgi:hypothetical protein
MLFTTMQGLPQPNSTVVSSNMSLADRSGESISILVSTVDDLITLLLQLGISRTMQRNWLGAFQEIEDRAIG